MHNFYSITTNQAAIAALLRVVDRYVGNLAPMPGVFPGYPAPVIRNADTGSAMVTMRWALPFRRVTLRLCLRPSAELGPRAEAAATQLRPVE